MGTTLHSISSKDLEDKSGMVLDMKKYQRRECEELREVVVLLEMLIKKLLPSQIS